MKGVCMVLVSIFFFFPQLRPKSDSRTPRQNIHQLGFPQSKRLGSWLAKSYCLFYLYQNALSVDILVIQHVLISQMLSDAVMNLRTSRGHLKTKDPTHAMQPRRCSCEFPSKKCSTPRAIACKNCNLDPLNVLTFQLLSCSYLQGPKNISMISQRFHASE